ncbi:MAE_28990/MAE_18760 family HEPN-like nuclease [Streptomyces europaeiscabiei]|uniref:MAE_28990/MAE_18760 family HEPN-like nuclease n=1 Tax=Streptomyces europaeiscabiei TaxID=146819 RepID=UPI0029A8F1B0|nr:MAE_28990/MAE_18760 family HEPN-like nuclease [Streptomyces europaeiscabiei]MDX3697212.1 MAE_28990/MAE_18760 family HEPN-like nuclease [Streptomyces europaeiscabiei]
MAAIRTLDQLQASLTENLVWRTHEMDQWQMVANRVRSHELPGILRGGLALIYAHWEGYVKDSACAYLEYVSRKGLKVGDLRPELAAIALRSSLGKGEQSKDSKSHTEIISLIRDELSRPAQLKYDSATIRTRSNLKFEVFDDIMHSIGCDASRHEIFRLLIDARLLKFRNDIAHGRQEYVALDDWMEIRDRVVLILKDVRDQISNSAAQKLYLASSVAAPTSSV